MPSMKKVLCFGEILLRLSPDTAGNWLKAQQMPTFLGGAELNVAHALARWDIDVAYSSALPDNYMSKSIISELKAKGIDMSRMQQCGKRIGIYYLAQGTDLKNAEVIYDRAHSSTADLQPGQINWNEVLKDVSWLHFTAITPAIDKNLVAVCREALETASKKNITISVDLNYRSKLWQWGRQPHEVMPELAQFCDVVMGNIWAAEKMLGIKIVEGFTTEKNECIEQAARTSQEIIKRFPKCKQVANTFRFDREKSLDYYATLYTGGKLYVSGMHNAHSIIDKVGSGDCFMAALIYGNIHALPEQGLIDFAAAAAVDKMFVEGDATTSGVEKIMDRVVTPH